MAFWLVEERSWGRDDYPVRAVWKSILAGVVFQHPHVESLRRELERNAQLRLLCGFDLTKGAAAVPSSSAYSRLLRKLLGKRRQIDAIFEQLVESLREVLPGFGRAVALDGKAIRSYARPPKKGQQPNKPDGRRDTDADWGVNRTIETKEDGTLYE